MQEKKELAVYNALFKQNYILFGKEVQAVYFPYLCSNVADVVQINAIVKAQPQHHILHQIACKYLGVGRGGWVGREAEKLGEGS